VMTISPAETAIIIADIAVKAAGVELGFVDRFSGSLIVTGTVSEVEAAVDSILNYVDIKLGFTTCQITRT
ncbi:MAG: BMC domain-containing protein, partial [Lachnospiraceae bacterium]